MLIKINTIEDFEFICKRFEIKFDINEFINPIYLDTENNTFIKELQYKYLWGWKIFRVVDYMTLVKEEKELFRINDIEKNVFLKICHIIDQDVLLKL